MKLHANQLKVSTTEYVSGLYTPTKTSAEANICGSCPYDKCVEDSKKTPCECKYFNEQIKLRKGKK